MSRLTPEEQDRIVQDNLGLASHIAGKFCASKMEHDDLVQEARIGLMDAAKRYNPDRGRFATYAAWHVLKAIMEAIRNRNEVVRTPRRHGSKICGYLEPEQVDGIRSAEADPAEAAATADEAAELHTVLSRMPHRDAIVLRLRHGINTSRMTLAETANVLGVSDERVRQIQAAAERKLRRALMARGMMSRED